MKPTSQAFLALDANSSWVGSPSFEAFSAKFWGSIKTSNGSWKTTSQARFGAADDALFNVLAQKHLVPEVALDIGVSSGVTTLDWYTEFKKRGVDVRMIAIDRAIDCFIVRVHPRIDALFEPNGHLLRIDAFGVGLRPWTSRRDYLTGALLLRIAAKAYVRHKVESLGIAFPISPSAATSDSAIVGPYQMIVPQLRGHANITVVEDDVLAPPPASFLRVADVVRLANILQHGYFNESQIRQIVRNVHARCRVGAIVLVCRNKANGVEGSIFSTLPDEKFALEARIGSGSEVESFFLGH